MKKILLTFFVGFILVATFNQSRAAFPVKQTQTVVVSNTTSEKKAQIVYEQNSNEEAVVEAAAKQDSGKSQLVALLFCIFLGGIAAHRWYLGKSVFMNILFIITGGGLGIWWLVDLIRIITGDLKPEDGEYEKTL